MRNIKHEHLLININLLSDTFILIILVLTLLCVMNKKILHSRWDQMITTQLLVFPTVKEKQT